jgi:hypothetical protein
MFLDRRREGKRFYTELYEAFSKFNLLLISQGIISTSISEENNSVMNS